MPADPQVADTKAAPVLDAGTSLAVQRTSMAADRTMMAWIRTATSLITFGFTIYKFFTIDKTHEPVHPPLVSARTFALILITAGLGSLVLATLDHLQTRRAMQAQYGQQQRFYAMWLATIIAVLGVAALLSVLFRQ